MANVQPKPSRWGAAPPQQGDGRDRSQSRNDRPPVRRGYDTETTGPPPFSRDPTNKHARDRDGFDRSGRRDSHGEYDWRCMECGDVNDPRDERCPRCARWKPRDDGRGRDREEDCDYYGHQSRRQREGDYPEDRGASRRKKSRHSDDSSKKREWPPAFELEGASYIFDARSGMFYEPSADFFYDPKTKLYYSNKKQTYFHFLAGAEPPFQPVGQKEVVETNHARGEAIGGITTGDVTGVRCDTDTLQRTNSIVSGGDSKAKIAISLKTTVLPSTTSAPNPQSTVAATERMKLIEKLRRESKASTDVTLASAIIPQTHKQHAKNMDVWSERVKEMTKEGDADCKTPSSPRVTTEIKTTISGQPICILCKRKFANLEKLQQHEKLSALHKENLEKKAAADASLQEQKESAVPDVAYRDRSKERRLMHGASADTFHVDSILSQVDPLRNNTTTTTTEVIRPEQILGDSNVGNQLLQKLGWKNGEALGRKQENDSRADFKGGSDVANCLKSDWERIEALAQGGGRGRGHR